MKLPERLKAPLVVAIVIGLVAGIVFLVTNSQERNRKKGSVVIDGTCYEVSNWQNVGYWARGSKGGTVWIPKTSRAVLRINKRCPWVGIVEVE